MAKMIIVKNCSDCDKSYWKLNADLYCELSKAMVTLEVRNETIHPDCPLEDAPEMEANDGN